MRIAGLDEVGRGALAGPLVAAGLVLNYKYKSLSIKTELRDSKKLNDKRRRKVYRELIDSGTEIVIESISVKQINSRGIGWANREVFRRIIKRIEADKYIVDGNLKLGRVRGKSQKIRSIIRADSSRKCVMAAAITAKVIRDTYMEELSSKYPGFDWKRNKGYGTKKHIDALRRLGMTKHHRQKFVTTALSEK